MIQNNDVWSPETYTNDLTNSTLEQTICNFTSQFQVCRCYGPFTCWGTSNTVASHESRHFILPKNMTVSQRLILVDNTRKIPLQLHPNGRDGVSKHQLHDCLLSHLFRRRSKKISKLWVTDDFIMRKLSIIGPMLGNHGSSMDSPYKGPATQEAFWCHCVMIQA